MSLKREFFIEKSKMYSLGRNFNRYKTDYENYTVTSLSNRISTTTGSKRENAVLGIQTGIQILYWYKLSRV